MRKLIQDRRPADFLELIPLCNEISALLKQNDDALRKFRNKVFHLRDTPKDLLDFITQSNRLEWAEYLQSQFRKFFSEYRVLHTFNILLQQDSSGCQE